MPFGMTTELEVEERTTTAGLESLGPEWSALWSRCPSASPFQAPEWLIPWWRHFHDGRPLWALALRHLGELVGLVPLFLHTNSETGRRVVLLSVEPRHPGIPSKKVWIDPTCKMVLREEVRNSSCCLIAASAFWQFELVRSLPASLFEPPAARVAAAGPGR